MYSKEKTLEVMREIKVESDKTPPYVVICQPRRNLKELAAQSFTAPGGIHIDVMGYSHAFGNIGGEKVDVARNWLIERAIESGAKYLLFVGEDTILPYYGFTKLHEIAEKNPDSAIIGLYYIKMSSPMVMVKNEWGIVPCDPTPGQLFEVNMAGMDAMLIPTSLLKKMQEKDPDLPWCAIAVPQVPGCEDLPFIGEDNFFYHRWQKAGYKVLCTTDVHCLHMDLASGKYTAWEGINEKEYITQIPLKGRLTHEDRYNIEKRWIDRVPSTETTGTVNRTALDVIADVYACDKSPKYRHNYTGTYAKLFEKKRDKVKKVLEIGVGGPGMVPDSRYIPGSSLYMWQDYFPNAEIYSIDIDPRYLVNSGRIHSYLCDQSSPEGLEKLLEITGMDFDLIIDDGSHRPEHQIISAQLLISALKSGGKYIIEDVAEPKKVRKALKESQIETELLEFNVDTVYDDRLLIYTRRNG